MDRFVTRVSPAICSPPLAKKHKSAKQGDLTAKQRSLQYVGSVFYSDGGRMFCRSCNMVVDHTRKSVVDAHIKSKVRFLASICINCYYSNFVGV